MRGTFSAIALAVLLTGSVSPAFGVDGHPVAQPLRDDTDLGEPSFRVFRERALIPLDHIILGAEHILDQQCANGGFGWPHDDCTATFHNLTGPILFGVLNAYYHTGDLGQLAAAINGGAFDLTHSFDNGEARFGTFTPAFMLELAAASDNSTFATFAADGFFGELAAGTYGPDDLDTAGWIANIEAGLGAQYVNLRPWDFHTLIPAAQAVGQAGQAAMFEQAVLDGLGTLDNSDPNTVPSDMIGFATAVRGLAFARRYAFPPISAPMHPIVDGIDNLADLVATLASLQNPDGSWNWYSNLASPGPSDEDVQTTAYGLLALLEADVMTAPSYRPAMQAARDWLVSMQLPNGGFPEYPGAGENTEVEGEAVTAIASFDALLLVDGFESGTTALWGAVVP